MSELREKVAAAILDEMDVTDGLDVEAARRYADRILAIPEIAEARKLTVISGHPLQDHSGNT